MKKPPKGQYKHGDVVKLGGIKGVILTTNSSNPEAPIQAIFVESKLLVGFNSNGEFILNGYPFVFPLEFVKRPSSNWLTKIKLWVRKYKRVKKKNAKAA